MIEIYTTGAEDIVAPWKVAVAGHPGSGKTMLASTSPKPLFVFFSEQPRLKSIAHRYVSHVKLVNAETPAHEQLLDVVQAFRRGDMEYETLVLDTGDELYQQMKEARREQNAGEFTISDWGWLSDAYREVMWGLIDLPVRLIVLYHLKTDSEQGIKELALQGASKDEAAGWFDVVAALDTYSLVNDAGEESTKRVLLTRSSRLYPWVKDHSGNLPTRFEISDGFVGDWAVLESHLNATASDVKERLLVQTIETVEDEEEAEEAEKTPIPTPDELEERKRENSKRATESLKEQAGVPTVADPADSGSGSGGDSDVETPEPETPEPETPEPETPEPETPEPETPEPTPEEAVENLQDAGLVEPEESSPEEPAKEVIEEPAEEPAEEPEEPKADTGPVCQVCGVSLDTNMFELSQMRFRKPLCKTHFKEEQARS